MSKKPNQELCTVDGVNIVIDRPTSPMENGGIIANADLLRVFNIFDEKFKPDNYAMADGKPLRLYDCKTIKIDVSKRSKEDMGFWHRNCDAHEIIFCVKGALHWETEMGERILRPGDMMLIPRGIAHRSRLCAESEEENVLVELKIAEPMEYVGENIKK